MRAFSFLSFTAIITALSLIFPIHVRANSGWLDNFSHRKEIILTNTSGGDLINSQLRFSLHSDSGTDSDFELYLNSLVQNDFDDIRFTPLDGTTELDYWIETVSSGVATVWVEVGSIPSSGTTTLYLYHGDEEASSESNGANTFPFFEDFDTNGISDWTGGNSNIDVGGEVGTQSLSTSSYFSSPNAAQLSTQASCASSPYTGASSSMSRSPSLPSGNYYVGFNVLRAITAFNYPTGSAGQASIVLVNGSEQFNQSINCQNYPGNTCPANSGWLSRNFTLSSSAINTFTLATHSSDCTYGYTQYDNVFVSKYLASDVSVSSRDSETEPTPTPTPTSQNSNATQPSGNPSAPSCTDQKPGGTSQIFQSEVSRDKISLFFSPILGTSEYFISYGPDNRAEGHGTIVKLSDSGVQKFTVESLKPGTTYSFKVRGQRGCATGDWSQTYTVKTLSGDLSGLRNSNSVKKTTSQEMQVTDLQVTTGEASASAHSHTVTLVINNNGQPLAGAKIELHSKPKYGTTNEKGMVTFTDVEKGEHTLKIAYNQYQAEEKLTVDGDKEDFNVAISVNLTAPESTRHAGLWFMVGSAVVAILVLIVVLRHGKKSVL